METIVHETAVVDPSATIGQGVKIGPYAIIEGDVTIGPNVTIGNHCVITGNTKIGAGCQFFTGAVIGSAPQDKKHINSKNSFLTIGDNNVFREYVTVNTGTEEGGGMTTIGDRNLFMAYAHVAHDCKIGSDCVVANVGHLAGHVIMEDRVIIGGLTGVHQFVRIGTMSIVGGCSKVVQDVPPYSMCDGDPSKVFGVNIVGLKRAQFTPVTISTLRKAFKILFHSGLTKTHAIEKVQQEFGSTIEVDYLIEFIRGSERGVCG
ncbi:MAG: acyl-ACP--UDP-N-acetylglucosamine O-acyltransferase [Candidatus Omnitrophica bacterium]|nr:acyl-ACP--UDP-N-acetylglucosamine O-acyltransferase [Candidatus Omnitrophota bacterium]